MPEPQSGTKMVTVDGTLLMVPTDATPDQIDELSKSLAKGQSSGQTSKVGATPPMPMSAEWFKQGGYKKSPVSDPWVRSKFFTAAPTIAAGLPTAGAMVGGAVGAVGGPPGEVGGAALGGGAGKALEDMTMRALGYKTPETSSGEAKAILNEGAIQALAARLGVQGSKWLKSATKIPKVAEWIDKYWSSRGVQMTAGEKVPNTLIGAVEPIAAKMPSAKAPVSAAMAERQVALTSEADKLATKLGKGSNTLPIEVNQAIDRSFDRLNHGIQQATSYIGKAAAGKSGAVDADTLAESVIGAVRGTHAAQDAIETQLYGEARGLAEAQDITIKNAYDNPATQFAEDELKRAIKASRIAASHIDPAVMSRLNVATQHKAKETVAQELFEDSFNNLDLDSQNAIISHLEKARPMKLTEGLYALSGITRMIKKLEGQGIYDDASLGALKQLKGRLRTVVMDSAPTNIKRLIEDAYKVTTAQKELFNTQFMRQMMTKKNPITNAKVIESLLRKGDSSVADSVLNTLPHNDPSWPVIRKGVVDWVEKTAQGDPEKMLRLVDNTPTVKKVLGSSYGAYRGRLESAIKWFSQPERASYLTWLEKVRGNKNPEGLVDGLAASAADRRFLDAAIQHGGADTVAEARLLGIPTKQALRENVARDALNRALDMATVAEGSKSAYVQFGQPGSYFDPVAFYSSFQKFKPVLEQYGDKQVVKDLAEFAEAGRSLRLSHTMAPSATGGMSAAWYAAMTLMRTGAALGAAATGHPIVAAGAMESIWVPKHFMQLAMSKRGSALLAEGSRIEASQLFGAGAKGAKWLIRVTDLLAEIAKQEKKPPQPSQQPQPSPQPVAQQ
jgi:hypothetical protein